MFLDLFDKFHDFLCSHLPKSPVSGVISSLDSSIGEFLGYINWIVPVKQMMIVFSAFLVALSAYYLYSIIARAIKAI